MGKNQTRFQSHKFRAKQAQSHVEMVAGLLVMVPVTLFLVDLAVLFIACNNNGDLAKSIARAAASAQDAKTAITAADSVVTDFRKSKGLISSVTLSCLNWESPSPAINSFTLGTEVIAVPKPLPGQVLAISTMTVQLPVPFPMLPSRQVFSAYSLQPIVGVARTN